MIKEWDASKEMDVRGIRPVKINQKHVRIKGHQHYFGWWVLTHESKYGHGGHVGDEMGFGKTLSVIWTTVLHYLITENKAEVKRFRDGLSTEHKHLQHGESGTCNRSQHYGFVCSCVTGSLAARDMPTTGATMIAVPTAVLRNWGREFKRWMDKKVAPLRVVAMHGNTLKSSSSLWNDDDKEKFSPDPPTGWEPFLVNKNLPYWEEENWNAIMSAAESPQARQTNHHSLVMITTLLSANSHIFQTLTTTIRPQGSFEYQCTDKSLCPIKPSKGTCVQDKHIITNREEAVMSSIQFARVWVDESHQIKGGNHQFLKQIGDENDAQQDWYGQPFCLWPVSGTPYSGGPADLGIWIKFNDTRLYKKYMAAVRSFMDLNKPQPKSKGKYALTQGQKRDRETAFEFITSYMKAHVIRRDSETKDLKGAPLIDLPTLHDNNPIKVRMSEDEILAAWFERRKSKFTKLNTWNKVAKDQVQQTTRLCRMFVSFPHLTKIGGSKYEMHNVDEIKKNGCWTSDETEYDKNLEELADTSPKFQELIKLLAEVHTKENRTGKLIICSSFPVVALVLYKVSYYRSHVFAIH